MELAFLRAYINIGCLSWSRTLLTYRHNVCIIYHIVGRIRRADRTEDILKIVFLDIDGVLNSRSYDKRRDWTKQTDIDETRLPIVKRVVDETGAKIVLSSTWRTHYSSDPDLCDDDGRYIVETFAKYGLSLYDKTPDLGYSADRRDEIKQWLDDGGDDIEAFVIIDDYRFGWGDLADRVVLTDPIHRSGIEDEHAEKAIALLAQ